jgi:hypothetical protein
MKAILFLMMLTIGLKADLEVKAAVTYMPMKIENLFASLYSSRGTGPNPSIDDKYYSIFEESLQRTFDSFSSTLKDLVYIPEWDINENSPFFLGERSKMNERFLMHYLAFNLQSQLISPKYLKDSLENEDLKTVLGGKTVDTIGKEEFLDAIARFRLRFTPDPSETMIIAEISAIKKDCRLAALEALENRIQLSLKIPLSKVVPKNPAVDLSCAKVMLAGPESDIEFVY